MDSTTAAQIIRRQPLSEALSPLAELRSLRPHSGYFTTVRKPSRTERSAAPYTWISLEDPLRQLVICCASGLHPSTWIGPTPVSWLGKTNPSFRRAIRIRSEEH